MTETEIENPVGLNESIERLRRPLMAFFVRRVGNISDAEDLTQETLIRASHAIDPERFETIDGYVFQIAANLIRDRARRAKVRERHHDSLKYREELRVVSTPEDVLDTEFRLHSLQQALDALPERTRQVFLLRRLENVSYKEMSEMMGISVSALEKHMTRAIAKVAKQLQDNDDS